MAKYENPAYEPDEFDLEADESALRGVHREKRTPMQRSWLYIALSLVIVLVAGIAILAILNIGGKEGNKQAAEATSSQSAAASASATPTPTPTQTTPEATIPASAPADANKKTQVTVLNAASLPGGAGKVRTQLVAAKWTNVTAGNYTGPGVSVSTIFYQDESQLPAVQALQVELKVAKIALVSEGGTEVTSAFSKGGITVVAAADILPGT